MAVPINTFSVQDILTELEHNVPTGGASIYQLNLSPNVYGGGLDPTYCSGNNGYQRLLNLRTAPYDISKFRNYQKPSENDVYYRHGFLYNPLAVNMYHSQLVIPSGWRIPSLQDWVNIMTQFNGSWTLANNTFAPHLKSIYTNEIHDSTFGWNKSGGVQLSATDSFKFKGIATGAVVSSPIALTQSGNLTRFWTATSGNPSTEDESTYCVQLSSSQNRLSSLLIDNVPGGIFFQDFFCTLRLFKNDSNNPEYLEFNGEIYKTCKIGNHVIMAEGFRGTQGVNPLLEGAIVPNYINGYYVDTSSYDKYAT